MQISWVLAAEDPARLASFYSELLHATVKPGVAKHHCIVEFSDGTRLEIYRPSRQRPFPIRGRALAPCLKLPPSQEPLPELQRLLNTSLQCGGLLLDEARLEPFGAEAWVHDPEGNPLLLLVPLASAGLTS
ncbi:hypothetical protein KR52_10075 [Synechococcus sp. KORDI-52]|uniref:VOC family protein n=1 Tax=Synechococcus sp. KORDI-52 TaxID=585425 RepID=UPI0004E075AA|nr:VOC family protein [Synechococcus sp. KORDI-52]AII49487.1 hypothetical protein KR52_10075 [Synechococcus sp. KORDI-52]